MTSDQSIHIFNMSKMLQNYFTIQSDQQEKAFGDVKKANEATATHPMGTGTDSGDDQIDMDLMKDC